MLKDKNLKDLIEYELVTFETKGNPISNGTIKDYSLPSIGDILELNYIKNSVESSSQQFVVSRVKREIYFDNPDYKKGGFTEKYIVHAE